MKILINNKKFDYEKTILSIVPFASCVFRSMR